MTPVSITSRHIAVIGTGIAGLSCATVLQNAGLKVTLYGKSRGPALDISCAWDSETGVGLYGDWLNDGKIEGASLSGQALARQVVESIADAKECPR